MRALIVGLAIFAAACSVETNGRHGGYVVDIRAVENDAVYVVTAPDGRVAAARVHDGTSAMLDQHALQQALAAMPAPSTNPRYDDHEVSIRAPGFSLQASGNDDDKPGESAANGANASANANANAGASAGARAHEATATPGAGEKPAPGAAGHDVEGRGHVTMNIGGFSFEAEGNGENGDGRASVHFAGLSAHDARHFITGADELSPQVQSQMLAALGLSQDSDK